MAGASATILDLEVIFELCKVFDKDDLTEKEMELRSLITMWGIWDRMLISKTFFEKRKVVICIFCYMPLNIILILDKLRGVIYISIYGEKYLYSFILSPSICGRTHINVAECHPILNTSKEKTW